ncbi:secretory lipase [Nocardia bhagyanarayanae]|uniref:Secretory lipase n=2 Tax=Nocardia bhagyanarayanae TaxID=1215925 RepID=A0A543EV53_9NOCA|nr:secretory lipase [Nocardia bhagyanarayanae]
MVLAALAALSSATSIGPASAQPGTGTEAGAIVSSRVLAEAELIPEAAEGYRLVYRTTGQNGEPAVSGGTIYVPSGTPPADGWPVVSWAHGTSGMTQGCAPTLNGGMADTFDETPQLSSYLAQGYAVEATDYIGLGAPGTYEYLAGRAAGHAVLDIVRAGHALDAALSKSFVAAGHSIGGQSALAAAQMWPSYAAELDLRGTVAYAPTSNVEDVIAALGRPGTPALPSLDGLHARLVMILAGLDHARPDVRVTDYVSPHGQRVLAIARAGEECLGALEAAVAGQPVGLLFSAPLADPPLMAALRDYLSVPTTGHHRPVLLLQGAADKVQPLPTTVLLHQQLQRGGADSRLVLHPAADHFTLLPTAASDTQTFLAGVLPAH